MTETQPPSLLTARLSRITWRAVLIGFAGAVFVTVYTPYNNYVLNNTRFIGSHFPIGVTALMLLLVLVVNPIGRFVRPSAALRSGDLIMIWSMMLIASAFPSNGVLRGLIPQMVTPIYALPQYPEWNQVIGWLPDWLFVSTDPGDDAVVTNFALGTEPGQPAAVPWGRWLAPVAAWGMFYVPLFLACVLLSYLLAPQWIRKEKLQFPLATVMLEIVADPPPGARFNRLIGDRRLWIAALFVIVLHTVNGLHVYFPKVPLIPLRYNLGGIMTEDVWAHIGWWVKSSSVVFTMVGITFLMSREVSFSLWTLCLAFTFVLAIMQHQGVNPWEAMRSQNYGAFLAMGVFLLYTAREHLWQCLRTLAGKPTNDPHNPEGLARTVVIGLGACLVACVAWLCWTGQPLWVAVVQVAILILTWLVLSRVVAETGMFAVVQRWWAPNFFTLPFQHTLTPQSQALAITSITPVFDSTENIMPFAFNVQRMGQPAIVRSWRRFMGLLVLVMLVSFILGAACLISIYYERGAVRTDTHIGFTRVTDYYTQMAEYGQRPLPAGQSPRHMAVGAIMIIAMGVCRMHWTRWPFVPIALCIATSEAMMTMWLSVMLGWICKATVMRVGGVSAYHRLRPMFIGLIIGEVLMAGVWMAVNAILRISGLELGTYQVLPIVSV